MNRTFTISLLACISAVLSGCANLRPETYKAPTAELLSKAEAAAYTGPVNGSLAEYEKYTDQLSAWHDAEGERLRLAESRFQEVGFGAAIVGVVAGATSHIQTARNALGIGAGATLLNDRYSLKVQAMAYEKAGEAFLCMRDHLADANKLETSLAATGALTTTRSTPAGAVTKTESLLTSYPGIPQQVRRSVQEVLRKLRTKLRTIDIPAPDFSKIKEALAKPKDQQVGVSNLRSQGLSTADLAPIEELRKNIEACAASFN